MPETLVKRNANVEDTIALILTRINTDINSPFVKKLAKALKPEGDKLAYIKRLFDYVCRNVKYQLDIPNKEDVYKPSTTVVNKKGDCKKMTVLIASVLKVAGIEPLIKHVFYDHENFTHVYVIVPYPDLQHPIIVDPVNDQKFNEEVQYSSGNIYDLKGNRMDLYTGAHNKSHHKRRAVRSFMDHANMLASGLDDDMAHIMGCPTMGADQTQAALNQIFHEASESTAGIGRKSKSERKAHRKEVFQKLKKVALKAGVAPMRMAFLTLVRLNVFKLATKMAIGWKKDPREIEKLWTNLGGKVDELKKTIIKGSKQQLAGPTMGIAVEAAIASATPILLAILKKLKGMGHEKEGGAMDESVQAGIDAAAEQVNNGTITQEHLESMPPDSGDNHIKDATSVTTEAPTDQTKELIDKSAMIVPIVPGGPSQGSFMSVMGICFKTPFLIMVMNFSKGSFLFSIGSFVNLYCIIGVIIIPFYLNGRMKWYFDTPVKAFYFLISITKKSFTKIIHHGRG